jgi:hypothetical protein
MAKRRAARNIISSEVQCQRRAAVPHTCIQAHCEYSPFSAQPLDCAFIANVTSGLSFRLTCYLWQILGPARSQLPRQSQRTILDRILIARITYDERPQNLLNMLRF